MQQPTSGEHLGLFSPGVPNGYGGWEGSFNTPPIVFPDSTTGGELNNPKRKRKQHDMEQFQEYTLDTAAAAAAALNWTTSASSDPRARKDKGKEKSSGARKRKRKEIETAVPWTEEMVQYLFETYDDVHRRLYIESRGKVKNQKKWDPIIKTMQERFHREFTKNQCESKYWKVRRECTKYKLRLEKKRAAAAAANDESYPGGKASVRELLKPKFYDVWLQVAAGENSTTMPEIEVSSASDDDDEDEMIGGAAGAPSEAPAAAAPPAEEDPEEEDPEEAHHHHHSSSCAIVREMQQLITARMEASEKREEALNMRAELTMELLRQHMERMERTGLSGDDARQRQRQLQMIEGVDNKLDRLVHGLSALNNNLHAIIGRLNPSLQRQ